MSAEWLVVRADWKHTKDNNINKKKKKKIIIIICYFDYDYYWIIDWKIDRDEYSVILWLPTTTTALTVYKWSL